MAKKVKEKSLYELVNENADRKKAERMTNKPKKDYSRIITISMFVLVVIMVIEVLMYAYGLYLVTRI